MATPTTQVKLTYDDYECFPADGRRHEILDGEHFMTPAPFIRHQRLSGRLHHLLSSYFDHHPAGEVLAAPCAVVLSEVDVVEPDLLFISAERAGIATEKEIRGAPDLVVEILSDSSRRTDELIKRKLYERAGVREYWVVDPVLDAVKVYRRDQGSFGRPAELTREAGDVLTTPLLPGLALPLVSLFA